MKKNAKLAALAILVLAAVAALSVGITLAVVNARMPAACTCSGQCRSAGTETAAAGDAPSAQQTEPSEADSISIPGFDFLSLQAGAQEQSMPLYNPENNACYFRISLLLDGEALWRSDLLAPGQTAPQQTLSRALAAGEYSAVSSTSALPMRRRLSRSTAPRSPSPCACSKKLQKKSKDRNGLCFLRYFYKITRRCDPAACSFRICHCKEAAGRRGNLVQAPLPCTNCR